MVLHDKRRQPAIPEKDKEAIPLSIDNTVDLLFYSFEISQASGSTQDDFFLLVHALFPTLTYSLDTPVVVQKFREKYRDFLFSGNHHTNLNDESIDFMFIQFLDKFVDVLKNPVPPNKSVSDLTEKIANSLIIHDCGFITRDGGRDHRRENSKYTSYTKKYFIDGVLPSEPHTRTALLGLRDYFFTLVDPHIDLQNPKLKIAQLEQATANFVLRQTNEEPMVLEYLMLLSQVWESKHPGEKFWEKEQTKRIIKRS